MLPTSIYLFMEELLTTSFCKIAFKVGMINIQALTWGRVFRYKKILLIL